MRHSNIYPFDTLFVIHIDEVASFVSARFGNVLSEARKYHTSYILAAQYLHQFDEELRAATFGNIGTLISFRIGAQDAEYLVKEFYPDVDMQTLLSLPNHQIYLKLMINGMTSRAFSAATIPPRIQ